METLAETAEYPMKKIKELNVFSHGDSAQISTWSNVPYFFTETLLAKGIKVNRININPAPLPEKIYDNLVWRLLNKLTRKHHFYTYLRTRLNYRQVRRRIKKMIARFPNADAQLFLSFSHSAAGLSKQPSVMFCDWTIDYYFKNILKRQPDALERSSLERQDAEIEKADLILCLFPLATEYMKERYRNPNIFYLGNVVNAAVEVSAEEAIRKKKASKNILFIGSRVYLEGAKALLQALGQLRRQDPAWTLNIIGMKREDFSQVPEGVNFHGYLDKAKEEERARYYELMTNAKMLINTTPKWGAFSSTIESMYFYTPVITSSYPEFEQTFGREIGFGSYCSNEPADIIAAIHNLIQDGSYEDRCRKAHEAVKDYTWDAYIDKVLSKIEEYL